MKIDLKTTNCDKRTIHTIERLYNALFDLLRKNSINKITVTMLCTKADINRCTFYSYYYDVYDLLESFLDVRLKEKMWLLAVDNDNAYLKIFEDVLENIDIMKILLSTQTNNLYAAKIIKEVSPHVLENWIKQHPEKDPAQLKILCTYILNGYISVLTEWVHDENRSTPEEISKTVAKLMNISTGFFSQE